MSSGEAASDVIVDSSDDDSDQLEDRESHRQEIQDIVRGFLLEKDLLSQGHEEELTRIKEDFQREKIHLLRQLEMERGSAGNSRIASTGSETGYGSRGSMAYLHSGLENSAGVNAVTSSRQTNSNDIDNNLVREIAEVYMRMSNCPLESAVRPDLDLEDKYEKEREVLERKFLSEKREMKRKLEENYTHKLEQERSGYESSLQELKSTISELQWQKRELESKIRTEKEKCEISFEREKNELEKRQINSFHEYKKQLDEKYSAQLERQKVKYEENITDLQGDIMNLTLQLRELNESLSQEKDIIIERFEKEIREMEHTFAEQRNSMKFSLESEFSLKLQNETSVLKTINKKLQDDLETLEKDKKEVERKCKEEKRRLEEHYEDEIAQMERKHSEERRNLKAKLEAKYQNLLEHDKDAMESTMSELREEVILLRKENSQIESTFVEKNAELRQHFEIEKEELNRKLIHEKEELRYSLEAEFSQKFVNESATQSGVIQQLDGDLRMMKTRCGELESAMLELRKENEKIGREREILQQQANQYGQDQLAQRACSESKLEVDQLKELIRQKENEISLIKLQKEQTEISMSALRREKIDLEDELARVKRSTVDASSRDLPEGGPRTNVATHMQENIRRTDEELQGVKRERVELEGRLSSLQRKNEELEDELATLRRKKLEVEDEISAIKRDKADSDDQVSYLKKEKAEVEHGLVAAKRKLSELEDAISANKREKMEKDHEISLLKRTTDTLQDEIAQARRHTTASGPHMDGQGQTGTRNSHENVPESRNYTDQQDGGRARAPGSRDTSHRNGHLYSTRNSVDQFDGQVPTRSNPIHVNERVYESRNAITQQEAPGLEIDFVDESVRRLEQQKQTLDYEVRELKQKKQNLELELKNAEKKGSRQLENMLKDHEEEVRRMKEERKDLCEEIKALREEVNEFKARVSHLKSEERSLDRRTKELTNNANELEFTLRELELEKQREEKVIQNLHRQQNDAQANLSQSDVRNNERHTNRISHVNIETVRNRNEQDHELASLRNERDDLKREVRTLKKQMEKGFENTELNNACYTSDMQQVENREVVVLKKERLQMERTVATLRRQKTEFEAEISVIREVKIREENSVNVLRKERVDLDVQVTNLRSQKIRLEAEISVMKEERRRDDNEVDHLRKEKSDLEKAMHSLRSEKTKVETDITMAEDTWRKRNDTSELRFEADDLEKELRDLRSERVEIQADVTRLNSMRNREDHELVLLRKHKTELEKEIEDLQKAIRNAPKEEVCERCQGTADGSHSDRFMNDSFEMSRPYSPHSDSQWIVTSSNHRVGNHVTQRTGSPSHVTQRADSPSHVTQSAGSPSHGTQTVGNPSHVTQSAGSPSHVTQRGGSLNTPSVLYSDVIIRGGSPRCSPVPRDRLPPSHSPRVRTSIEITHHNHHNQAENAMYPDKRYARTEAGASYASNEVQQSVSYHPEQADGYLDEGGRPYAEKRHEGNQDRHAGNVDIYNDSVDASRVRDYSSSSMRVTSDDDVHSFPMQEDRVTRSRDFPLPSNNNSSKVDTGGVSRKENNDVASLRRERKELELQISELKVQLTRLQENVMEMEHKKVVMETVTHKAVEGGLTSSDDRFREEFRSEVAQVNLADKRDGVIEEYEARLRELREANMNLKQRVGLLEWQLENATQRLEIQEMSFRRQQKAGTENNIEGGGISSQDESQLHAFYRGLHNLLVKDISGDELRKQIKIQMNDIDQNKINIDYTNVNTSELRHFLTTYDKAQHGTDVKSVNGKEAGESDCQLRKQLEIAEAQLKKCEKIIHRLYAENSDLNKTVLKLEGKLKSSSRSQEKLLRKRVLLQKLVERLSNHVGKDQLEQSYLVLELDKDIAI